MTAENGTVINLSQDDDDNIWLVPSLPADDGLGGVLPESAAPAYEAPTDPVMLAHLRQQGLAASSPPSAQNRAAARTPEPS